MTIDNDNSQVKTTFHLPEPTMRPVGYLAIMDRYGLRVPGPARPCVVGTKHQRYEIDRWRVFTPRHEPEDNLAGHLTFALKYEGVDLGCLSALFHTIDGDLIAEMVRSTPTGSYSRRLWFFYEWLTDDVLDVPNAARGNYVSALDEKIQYGTKPTDSPRHRVHNNLPGTRAFCPLIHRTKTLDRFSTENLSDVAHKTAGKTHVDLLSRAASFLLMDDSKASFAIEGETPPRSRIERWGRVIGEAGRRDLTIAELERLQAILIEDQRFVRPGLREDGGFVGVHERNNGMPIPSHISARPDDLKELLGGVFALYQKLRESAFDPVMTAALVAFGFVFIHPFEDGNGRLHRYLFHHVLADMGFSPPGLVFPISAVILERLVSYRDVLEEFSSPRLSLVEWRPTANGNVEVLNETIDLYRFFDATHHAEFLFECVERTVTEVLPNEVSYLEKYDHMTNFVNSYLDMPSHLVDLLIRFLAQNGGVLSKRARQNEFAALTDVEVVQLETKYVSVFGEEA